jgi:hypothetical protein
MIEIEAVVSSMPEKRVRADAGAAARQPRSEEGPVELEAAPHSACRKRRTFCVLR